MATLWERVEQLEQQVQGLLQGGGTPVADRSSQAAHIATDTSTDERFYALNGLKQQLLPPGGVVFAGSVELPAGQQIDWQFAQASEMLLSEDWAELGESIAALGNPIRLRLLREVLNGTDSAAELSELEGMGSTGQVYHHLRTLASAGWLRTAARGRYEVPENRVVPLLVMVLAARP